MHLFLLAGHETSANTTAIAFSLLAFHPAIQATLQQELDDIFSGRDPESASWSFEKDYPRLVNGYVGALLNETLRLYPTLPLISKCTGDMPQEIVTEARTFVVPADTLVVVNIAATHRNPRYWPGDADAFDPTRWLGKDSAGPDAFLPFSNGYRACLGKRFAQIEFCAVVARVFSQYSVMLADDACNGGDVGALGALDSHVSFGMTLKLREDFPLRFVRRSGLSL
jgi:cytochrome P450